MQQLVVFLTVNSPVLGSNPTCTVCSKSTGDEISGRSFTAQGGTGEGKEGGKEGRGKIWKQEIPRDKKEWSEGGNEWVWREGLVIVHHCLIKRSYWTNKLRRGRQEQTSVSLGNSSLIQWICLWHNDYAHTGNTAINSLSVKHSCLNIVKCLKWQSSVCVLATMKEILLSFSTCCTYHKWLQPLRVTGNTNPGLPLSS